MTKMAKIDTLFMTKMAEKPGLWGCTNLYSPYRGVPPPPPAPPRTIHQFTATFHDSGARHAMDNGLILEQGWLLVAKWRLLSKVSGMPYRMCTGLQTNDLVKALSTVSLKNK